MILPANSVMAARPDWQIDLHYPGTVQIGTNKEGEVVGVKGLEDPAGIDLMVMQRIGSAASLKFLRWASDRGIAVVVDADDALYCIDRENMAYRSWNGGQMHWQYMEQAAQHADLMTVTTDALARHYGKHGRVEVIPNRIPAEVLTYPSIRDTMPTTVTLGWTGFTATHPGDLRVCGSAVKRAVEDTGAIVRVIGDGEGARRDWGLDAVESIGPLTLGPDYFSGLTTLDIGLVPLADGKFNRAKSSLKALEMSAMGLPVICSPTPANKELGRDLPLLFASSPLEWYEMIVRLVRNPSERQWRGDEARDAVRARWLVEQSGEQWAQVWERAMSRRARMTA